MSFYGRVLGREILLVRWFMSFIQTTLKHIFTRVVGRTPPRGRSIEHLIVSLKHVYFFECRLLQSSRFLFEVRVQRC